MYMFDLQSVVQSYIPVCYTNGRSIQNTISVVVNQPVGMGLHEGKVVTLLKAI